MDLDVTLTLKVLGMERRESHELKPESPVDDGGRAGQDWPVEFGGKGLLESSFFLSFIFLKYLEI